MKTRVWGIVAILVSAAAADAVLLAGPRITDVAVHPENPDRVVLRVTGLERPGALSDDGGATFSPVDENEIPWDWSTDLSLGLRRYALADSVTLFRPTIQE